MINVLKAIKKEMTSLGINYVFDDWKSTKRLPYFVGEIDEVAHPYEDGRSDYSFMLTGENKSSYQPLIEVGNALKNRYKYTRLLNIDNGVLAITYNNMILVPVEDEDIKRVQINLSIKLWEN